MPDPLKSRDLTEPEFNAIKARVIAAAPDGLDEKGFNRYFGPAMEQALAQAEYSPAPVEGSAISRFAGGVAEMVNPVAMVKGAYQAVAHPVDTATAIGQAHAQEFGKFKDAYGRLANSPDLASAALNTSEVIGHGLATALPVLGPMAAAAGERIASGDIAGGVGNGVGLVAPFVIKPAVQTVKGAIPTDLSGRTAQALDTGAKERLVKLTAPKVGPNKLRLGGVAEEVAPRLAREPGMGAYSVEGLSDKIAQRLSGAEALLDEAADARLSAKTFQTKPIIDGLKEKRAALTSEATKASETPLKQPKPFSGPLTKKAEPPPQPIGADVVPGPNSARVAVIDQAISELEQLGPVASYEAVRRLRQAYDGQAKVAYNPSITQDFLKAKGGALGAADVTSVAREHLGKWDPATAAANAEYSFWRKADDVVSALAEVERSRPVVGRKIMARLTGATVGGASAGGAGALAGAFLGPIVEAAVGAGPTMQVQVARKMAALADAIRKGDQGAVVAASHNLRQMVKDAAKKSRAPGAVAIDHETSRTRQTATAEGLP